MLVRIVRVILVMCCAIAGFGVGPAGAVPGGANPVLVIGGIGTDVGPLEVLRTWLGSRGYTAYWMVLRAYPTENAPFGSAPIAESAQAVAEQVAEIRRETGAERVDLVGHSMGGLAQRHYIKFLGGLGQVGTYVDVGTPELGIVLALECADRYPGCRDLLPWSEFIRDLNAPPAIPPGLPAYHLYTEIAFENVPLPGATNASVQSFCAGRRVAHGDQLVDGAVQQLIDSALRGGPLSTTCP